MKNIYIANNGKWNVCIDYDDEDFYPSIEWIHQYTPIRFTLLIRDAEINRKNIREPHSSRVSMVERYLSRLRLLYDIYHKIIEAHLVSVTLDGLEAFVLEHECEICHRDTAISITCDITRKLAHAYETGETPYLICSNCSHVDWNRSDQAEFYISIMKDSGIDGIYGAKMEACEYKDALEKGILTDTQEEYVHDECLYKKVRYAFKLTFPDNDTFEFVTDDRIFHSDMYIEYVPQMKIYEMEVVEVREYTRLLRIKAIDEDDAYEKYSDEDYEVIDDELDVEYRDNEITELREVDQ